MTSADDLLSGSLGAAPIGCSARLLNAGLAWRILDSGIAYLQKPFTPETLARKVREVLDRRAPEPA